MKPKVSVVTLTYKNYDKLYDTIKSVLIQDYYNIEYIISDDASGDFPKEEIVKFIDENNVNDFEYKIIINEENLGTVKNFNNAIRNCNGTYIFPLSGNDIFYNDHVVTELVDVFTNTNCKMVITGKVLYENEKIKCVYPHVNDIKNVYRLKSKYEKYRALMLSEHYEMFIGCNIYYDKSALEKYGLFDERYRLLEDLPILEKFLWNEEVELKPEFISISYDAKTGVTRKKNKAHPILQKDITLFNKSGKLAHYDELDKKTQKHIDFGIKRANAKNNIQIAFICLGYLGRIFSYSLYRIREIIQRSVDRKKLK